MSRSLIRSPFFFDDAFIKSIWFPHFSLLNFPFTSHCVEGTQVLLAPQYTMLSVLSALRITSSPINTLPVSLRVSNVNWNSVQLSLFSALKRLPGQPPRLHPSSLHPSHSCLSDPLTFKPNFCPVGQTLYRRNKVMLDFVGCKLSVHYVLCLV